MQIGYFHLSAIDKKADAWMDWITHFLGELQYQAVIHINFKPGAADTYADMILAIILYLKEADKWILEDRRMRRHERI